ncbi:Gfo/Idh/MocA family protein [Crateriforma conspicua]|uniref:Gfo/Idh/MocA family protein n=1 Tax=Crateriforma conspicua TaxID=2527996 RepID=UPI00118C6304|nr:twin-arginine translocation signal domain-containing protein [Crateriforma conspicua]QDV65616.1 hypothetical protein Mal65_47890 [Crateriforma conspicua]
MSDVKKTTTENRRSFMKKATAAATSATLVTGAMRRVHAAEDHTIRLALIGSGGRGAGAVVNAFNTKDQGPIKLHAVADLESSHIQARLVPLTKKFPDQVDAPEERWFLGFDAYKKAIDTLRPGDVAMCTTRAYIRPVHVEYAVSKGINVFMEKPFACDPRGLQRMANAGKMADEKGVKIACGLQCRHSPARAALIEKLRDGELGELAYVRANRRASRRWMGSQREKSNIFKEQLKFGKTHLLWVGSGHMVDNLIHQIDECCWIMDDWPVSCDGMGGREVGSTDHGQNIDTYTMEYTFPDGRKAFCGFRRAEGGHRDFATYIHGSKRAAQFSGNVHKATVHMYKDLRVDDDNIDWRPEADKLVPWDYEWVDFVRAIRSDTPYNECHRAVKADYASLMGRAAAHYNRIVTMDEIVNSNFQFCDYLDDLTDDSPPPVLADADGVFPAPVAGKWIEI